jgi:hypothetical protein
MIRLGWGLFSVALGIAVQVSGVKGAIAEDAAWAAVTAGITLLATAWIRAGGLGTARREHRLRREVPLDRAVQRLGKEVLAFIYIRDTRAPGFDSSESTLRHPVRAARLWQALRAYEEDTVAMYRERFEPDLRSLLHELVGVYVGRNEARRLLSARTVLEVEGGARRLVEIGESVGAGRSRHAA